MDALTQKHTDDELILTKNLADRITDEIDQVAVDDKPQEPETVSALIFLGILLALIVIGMPIAFALLFAGVGIMLQLDQFDAQIVVQNAIGGADNFVPAAVPSSSWPANRHERRRPFQAHRRPGQRLRRPPGRPWLRRHFRGGAAGQSFRFGGGRHGRPRRHPRSHDAPGRLRPGLPCGLMAAGGIIAPVIPPSIGFLLFGVVANISITRLFLAGIVPGCRVAPPGGGLVAACRGGKPRRWPRSSPWAGARRPAQGFWALLPARHHHRRPKFGIFTPPRPLVAAAYAPSSALHLPRTDLAGDLPLPPGFWPAPRRWCLHPSPPLAMVASYMITIADIPGQVGQWMQVFAGSQTLLVAAMMVAVFWPAWSPTSSPSFIFTPVFLPIAQAAGWTRSISGGLHHELFDRHDYPPVGWCSTLSAPSADFHRPGHPRRRPLLIAETAGACRPHRLPALVTVPAGWWR